jgi:hypothetical protein
MAVEDGLQRPEGAAGEWSIPLPEKTPSSTYAPAFLALGITFLLFGVVSSYVFSAAGFVLIVVSISKWVRELLHGE